VRNHSHQALSLKLDQRLTHGNPADAKASGKRILAQLRTRRVGAAQNLLAEPIDNGARQRSMLKACVHDVDG
jgi:hypothetical protein